MANPAIHVVPYQGIWAARKAGHNRVSTVQETKNDAIEAAKQIAYNQGLDVIIHRKDGTIQKVIKFEDLSGDNCFITTACVKYYNLDDKCYQLETLRAFRDGHLMKYEVGKRLVTDYYRIAPQIVGLLETATNREELFNAVFLRINEACNAIEIQDYEMATLIYRSAILYLMDHFKLEYNVY